MTVSRGDGPIHFETEPALTAAWNSVLSARVPAAVKIPKGLGALTVSLLDGEGCDWKRFRHRNAIGGDTGCGPSEHSSGGVQRFCPIDWHGNKHVRMLLVEAVWRLLKYQPGWLAND